ncbi:unnamed protein product [Ilex paraguariensis]|uniref:Uncharacterized protein n=1 Tax=Ilex paraguariensis TaxID=185542 RepID=A0ABC8RSY6_9AQUA
MAPMATEKIECHCKHDDGKATKEEDVLDVHAVSQMCRDHGRGISAFERMDDRKPTIDCDKVDADDGSGDVPDICPAISQQAYHFKCIKG